MATPAGRRVHRRLGPHPLGRHDSTCSSGCTTAPATPRCSTSPTGSTGCRRTGSDGIASLHNVNFAQGFREPAQYWQLSGDAVHRDADLPQLRHDHAYVRPVPRRRVRRRRERAARLRRSPAGLRDLRRRRVHGQPRAAHPPHRRPGVGRPRPRTSRSTCCPPALDPHGKVTHYVTSANVVRLDNVAQDPPPVPERLRHAGLQARHHATTAAARTTTGRAGRTSSRRCGCARRTAGSRPHCTGRRPSPRPSPARGDDHRADRLPVRGHDHVHAHMPQRDRFSVRAAGAGLVREPTAAVNGSAVDDRRRAPVRDGQPDLAVPATPSCCTLPMTPRTRVWGRAARVSVDHGALTFSLAVRRSSGAGTPAPRTWPEYEVTSQHRVELRPDSRSPAGRGHRRRTSTTRSRWPPHRSGSPCDAQTDPGLDRRQRERRRHAAGRPGRDRPRRCERVTLVPMGAARLRITAFPRTGGTRDVGHAGTGMPAPEQEQRQGARGRPDVHGRTPRRSSSSTTTAPPTTSGGSSTSATVG